MEKFALWWARVSILFALCIGVALTAAPVKTFDVVFQTVNGDAVVKALAADLDVRESVEGQVQQVGKLVPVEELNALEGMLGESRTQEIVQDATSIRNGLGKSIASASGETVDNVIVAVPQFLKGEDLAGSALREALQIDLRPFRSEIEAWLTKAGRLFVEAISEAIQAQVIRLMEPAVGELFEGQEYENLMDRLSIMEASFDTVQEVTSTIGSAIKLISSNSGDGSEIATAIQNVAGMTENLSSIGGEATRRGKAVLQEASEAGITDWGAVIESVTREMIADIKTRAQALTDNFARDFTTAIFGSGLHEAPDPVRIVLVEQLRPLQVMVAPIISSGKSVLTILNAALFTGVFLIVLAAGRLRRLAFWGAITGVVVSLSASAFEAGLNLIAQATAKAIGGLGEGFKELGLIVTWMMNLVRKGLEFFLDMEIEEFKPAEGWTADDVLNSLTYGVIQTDILDRLSDWASAVMYLSLGALALWLILVIIERTMRSQEPAPVGSWKAALQQPGGLRVEDPMLLLLPSTGSTHSASATYGSASVSLIRGVLIDAGTILLISIGSFTIVGLFIYPILSMTGTVVATAAIAAGAIAGTTLIGARLVCSGTSTVAGWLAGDSVLYASDDGEKTLKTTLISVLPWVAAIALGVVLSISLGSAIQGFSIAIGALLLAEIAVILVSGGQNTLGAKINGLPINASGDMLDHDMRIKIIGVLNAAGTIWSLAWGALLTFLTCFGGMYAIVSGLIAAGFWYSGRTSDNKLTGLRYSNLLRLGNFLSFDLVGVGLGVITLRLLQDDPTREHFSAKDEGTAIETQALIEAEPEPSGTNQLVAEEDPAGEE